MKTFKLVNPLIVFDKFNNKCKAKDIYEAIDNIYVNYTNFFTKLYTPITFMSLKDENNKLYHFQINEKSKGNITYKIKKIKNDKKKDVKFIKIINNINKKNINGGKYYDSDFDINSDSDSDSDYEIKYKKKSKYKSKSRSSSTSSSSSSLIYKKKSNKIKHRKYSSESSNSSESSRSLEYSDTLNSSSSSISLDIKFKHKIPLYYYCPDLYDNDFLYMPTIYYIPDNNMYLNENNNIMIDALL